MNRMITLALLLLITATATTACDGWHWGCWLFELLQTHPVSHDMTGPYSGYMPCCVTTNGAWTIAVSPPQACATTNGFDCAFWINDGINIIVYATMDDRDGDGDYDLRDYALEQKEAGDGD